LPLIGAIAHSFGAVVIPLMFKHHVQQRHIKGYAKNRVT